MYNAMIVDVFKPYGVTPKELVDSVVEKYKCKKGAFAGRLDPMACGVTRIYMDESCKFVDNGLDKCYRFIIIFGIKTTSFDLLGLPTFTHDSRKLLASDIERVIQDGELIQEQPIHSSFRVSNSKGIKNPLWWWALHDRMSEVVAPRFKRTLYSHSLVKLDTNHMKEIAATAIERIGLIDKKHDFKQDVITREWEKLSIEDCAFQTAEIIATVSSGFYIRQLVNDIGKNLGLYTTTFEIERLAYV